MCWSTCGPYQMAWTGRRQYVAPSRLTATFLIHICGRIDVYNARTSFWRYGDGRFKEVGLRLPIGKP